MHSITFWCNVGAENNVGFSMTTPDMTRLENHMGTLIGLLVLSKCDLSCLRSVQAHLETGIDGRD